MNRQRNSSKHRDSLDHKTRNHIKIYRSKEAVMHIHRARRGKYEDQENEKLKTKKDKIYRKRK